MAQQRPGMLTAVAIIAIIAAVLRVARRIARRGDVFRHTAGLRVTRLTGRRIVLVLRVFVTPRAAGSAALCGWIHSALSGLMRSGHG